MKQEEKIKISINKNADKSVPIPYIQIPQGGRGGSIFANNTITILMFVFLVGAISAAGYFYKQFSDIKKNPNKAAQDEINATVAAVGKLIILPADEQPTLATVVDPNKLKNDQPFFARAQKGDKVLIYNNAKKAILYNPESNKIVEVAPINIGAPVNTTPASTATSSAKPK